MRQKTVVLILIPAVMFLSGFVQQSIGPLHAAVEAVLYLFPSVLTFAWFRLDTERRSYSRSRLSNVGVLFLPLLALPYYFFRTRGAWRGALASLLLFAMLIACAITLLSGALAAMLVVGAAHGEFAQ